jgi:hypothetical protein
MCAILSRAAEPFRAGFGVDGRGFTCLEVPEEELLPPVPNAALVSINKGDLTVDRLEEELKDLVEDDWAWKVQRLSAGEFAVVFPSKESLRLAIRGGGLNLPSSKLHATVTVSSGDPAACEHLSEIWVKLLDVPQPYRSAVRILLATRELGRPIGWKILAWTLRRRRFVCWWDAGTRQLSRLSSCCS